MKLKSFFNCKVLYYFYLLVFISGIILFFVAPFLEGTSYSIAVNYSWISILLSVLAAFITISFCQIDEKETNRKKHVPVKKKIIH